MSNPLQEIARYRREIAQIEKQLSRQRQKLLGLPARLGYGSIDDLVDALKAADAGRKPAPGAKASSGRKRRVKITNEIKAKVKSLAAEGTTGLAIAKATGISLPSVQNIKKELGLVKKRG